jgi:hypothetical protein
LRFALGLLFGLAAAVLGFSIGRFGFGVVLGLARLFFDAAVSEPFFLDLLLLMSDFMAWK